LAAAIPAPCSAQSTGANLVLPNGAEAQTGAVSIYPVGFFESAKPYSALDMVTRLPGFTLDVGDADVRGFAQASSNVLIDGQRPASKQETIEQILTRIPASVVERIELIRAAVPGIEMQGRSVLANIVRKQQAMRSARGEAGGALHAHGLMDYRLAGEVSLKSQSSLIEMSAAAYRDYLDTLGVGTRNRVDGNGAPIRTTDFEQNEGSEIQELTGAYERALATGNFRANGAFRHTYQFSDTFSDTRFPVVSFDSITERRWTDAGELGLRHDRRIGARSTLELLAIHRREIFKLVDTSDNGATVSRRLSKPTETILRAVLKREGKPVSLEMGGEAALNTLDNHAALQDAGLPVDLPAADVQISEKRIELFLISNWRPGSDLTLEAGSRVEASQLDQTGDSQLQKRFVFLKPRVLLSWAIDERQQVRVLAERLVGQLDFNDFVSTSNLGTSTVNAGNRDLEPDRTWRAELALERHFWGSGALVLTARYEAIDGLIDLAPIVTPTATFDAVSNIGRGARVSGIVDLTLPLDRLGVKRGVIKGTITAKDGSVTDPVTGVTRGISFDPPISGAIHFTQDLPRRKLRWGIDVTLGTRKREFRFNEIRTARVGTRLGMFVEYKPTRKWNLRLLAKNLTNSPASRERLLYRGLRDRAPLNFVENRLLRSGPYFGMTIQRQIG